MNVFVVLTLVLGVVPVAGWFDAAQAAPFSLTAVIASGTDDAEEGASGSMTIGSSDLELVEETSTQTVGLRYSTLAIPPGAAITSAYIQFRSDEVHSGPTNLTIAVQAADNPGTFTTTPGNISSRLRASTTVAWAPPAWTATKLTGPAQATPDLSVVLQQVIDRPGWASGNAVVFILTGSGKRVADSFEGGPNNAPVLYVEYGAGDGNLPPVVTARADSTFLTGAAVLDGNVIDDGNPTGNLATTWSKVSGPGTVIFADPSAVDTTATFSEAGSYVLQLTADDGEAVASDIAPVAAVDGAAGQPGSVQIGIVGDLGDGDSNEAAVAQLVQSFNPDFIATLGDNSYGPAGQDANVGKNYSDYMGNYDGAHGQGSALNRFFTALGNHDIEDAGGLSEYLAYYTLPGGGISSTNTSGNERYYDIVQGPVHMFFLNTDVTEPDGRTPTSTQGVWLQNRLAASTSPWKIVVAHDAPYASAGATSAMRWPYQAWGADIVLSGDAHLYERLEVGGFPYIINGLGGSSRKALPDPISPDSQVIYRDQFGAMIAEACTSGVTFKFYSVDNVVRDTFTLGTACGSLPAPTNLGTTAAEGLIDLAWTDTNGGTVSHEVDRSVDGTGGPFLLHATVAAGTTIYQDTGLSGSTEYCYRVRASGSGAVSPYSNISCATTPQPNQPPVANDDTAQTLESSQVNINVLANDTDADGNLDPATVAVTIQAADGSATVKPDGTIDYLPSIGFTGDDTFTYEVCDSGGLCDTAQVTVTVGPLNQPPIANDVNATTDEDVVGTWVPNVSDPDSTGLECSIVAQPSVGSATISSDCSAGSYTPPANFNGPVSFTYQVADSVSTDTGLVSFTVQSVADAPEAVADGALAGAGTTIQINVVANDTDVDGDLDPNSVTITGQPSSGSASHVGGGVISYTAPSGFSGSVQITYEVCDLTLLCDSAIVTVDVTNAPTIVERRVINGNDDNEEQATGGTRIGSSDLELVNDGTNQTVGIRIQNLTVPQGMTISKAYLKFQVDEATSETTNLTIMVQATDNATAFTTARFDVSSRPVLAPSVAWSPPAWPTVGASGADQTSADISSLVQAVVNRPGWVSGNSIAFTITGTGKRIAESYNGSSSGAPLLHVEYVPSGPSGSAPVANPDSATTLEDTPATVTVLTNDSDPDGDLVASSVSIVTNGTLGTAVANIDGTVTYTPNLNANGSDTFTYRVCDSGSRCADAVVTMTVTPVPDAPVAVNDSASAVGTTPVVIDVMSNDSDPDGDLVPGSVTITTTPSQGTAVANGLGAVTYTPNPGATGADSFVYEVCDATSPTPLCASATVTLTIQAVNLPPTAEGMSIGGPEDLAIPWTPVVNDPEGASLTCSISTAANNGIATVAADCTSGNYVPTANANGADSFVYTVSDGVSTAIGTVAVTVSPVSDPPVAVDDGASTTKNSAIAISVLDNDTDPDGDIDASSVSIVSPPSSGTITSIVGGVITYTPTGSFIGSTSFIYQVCDGTPTCATAQVTVTVTDTTASLDVQVSASTDDNEERANGRSRIASSDLELVEDRGSIQIVGLRFQNVQIPAGSTITNAYIQFQTNKPSTETTNLVIEAQNHANPPTFSTTKYDIAGRSLLASSVPWTAVPAWNVAGESGPNQRTSNISSLVQGVIDLNGWAPGNSAVFIITGAGLRDAESYDGSPTGAPILHVEFQLPSSASLESGELLLLDSSSSTRT